MIPETDPRLHSPAAERNGAPILDVLRARLPERGFMLEIASGSGQHAARFAAALPGWQWQPSEADDSTFDSICAWAADAGARNVLEPIVLDVLAERWPVDRACDAVFCANLLHIAPPAVTPALLHGAARHLRPAAPLLVYGPFWIDDEAPAASNLAFDASLRERNGAWGIRRLPEVVLAARAAGLELAERIAMPAHNQLLVFAGGQLSG